jgi:hypothetical protein
MAVSGSTATPMRPPLPRIALKKVFIGRPDSSEATFLHGDPSFVPGLHMMGTPSGCLGTVCVLMVARVGLAVSSGTPERSHAAATRSGWRAPCRRPVPAAAVAPERPGHLG